jgi:hypothetical protein
MTTTTIVVVTGTMATAVAIVGRANSLITVMNVHVWTPVPLQREVIAIKDVAPVTM